MKIYIDVSCMVKSSQFVTGIQRVVREVTCRLIDSEYEVVLLFYGVGFSGCNFQILDSVKFNSFYVNDECEYNEMFTHDFLNIDNFEQNAIFFDIDSSGWMQSVNRHVLYNQLRNRNIKIAVNVYDVIPITFPQYCGENILFFYMEYFTAVLKYADLIVTNTNAVYSEIKKIAERVGINVPANTVVPLGSDFKKSDTGEINVRSKIKKIASNRYVLLVGTLEPRKNHSMVLDAFDDALFNENLCLIFVGRWGWRIEDVQSRIRSHPELSRKLFHIEDANDDEVKHLYKNAFAVVCSSFEEGFGLPVIEGLLHGTPVFASDIPVFREVGEEYCKYFSLNGVDEFTNLVKTYQNDAVLYSTLRNKVGSFMPNTWENSKNFILSAFACFNNNNSITPQIPKQIVILSARMENLLSTLPFIENFMQFITEIVVCCPINCKEVLEEKYNGRLALKFLTDESLLNGNPLPDDHAVRNYYLRCLAVQSGMLDDVFIMGDDDYRPLRKIEPSLYVENGKYNAFFCYDLCKWEGDLSNLSSYDISMRKSALWLTENGMPTLQYSSHMPQIIDSRIFINMLNEFSELPLSGLAEWCTYFNYAVKHYSSLFNVRPYVTLGWPGSSSEWELLVNQTEYLFENYYEHLYEDGQLYSGLSKGWCEGIPDENITKVSRYALHQADYNNRAAVIKGYVEAYNKIYREEPSITIVCKNIKSPKIYLPTFFVLPVSLKKEEWIRLPVSLAYDGEVPLKCSIETCFCDEKRKPLRGNHKFTFTMDANTVDVKLPLLTWGNTGRFLLSFEFCIEKYNVSVNAETVAEFV